MYLDKKYAILGVLSPTLRIILYSSGIAMSQSHVNACQSMSKLNHYQALHWTYCECSNMHIACNLKLICHIWGKKYQRCVGIQDGIVGYGAIVTSHTNCY
jgi:hypothetical protein